MSRAEDLKEWERSRISEVKLDLFTHWNRSLSGVVVAVAAWYAVDWFDFARPDVWRFAVALLALVYLVGRVIVWLRLEGAYVERRLIEIEALIANATPIYYTSGDVVDFDRNPLFERLDQLQHSVDSLRKRNY